MTPSNRAADVCGVCTSNPSLLKGEDSAVRTVPALYLVSNDSKTVTLLGTGALAGDEIVERVRVLKATRPGQAM